MRLILSVFAVVLIAAPAFAAQTPWQELAPGVKARLISADAASAEGTTMIALELDMPPDFKTYWRVPGETGIATTIDWTGSNGITAAEMLWPYPIVETKAGYVDFVYYGPTVLPIRITLAGEGAEIETAILMGICSDICVPATASFSLALDLRTPDRGQGLRINQALALVPREWPGEPQPVGDIWWDAEAGALAIAVSDPAVDPGSLIASPADASVLFGAPQKSPEPGIIFLPLLGKDEVKGLASQVIQVTFKADGEAFEVLRQLVERN